MKCDTKNIKWERCVTDYSGFTFSIGVVGHRNVADDALAQLEASITLHLESLAQKLGASSVDSPVVGPIPIRVYTALAEGADRIFTRVAMRVLGARVSIVAVLPTDAADYERDFPDSVTEFRDLLALCNSVIVVDQTPAASRNTHYRRAWEVICAKSNLLFALWDMKPGLEAGTAQCLHTRCFSAPKTQMGEAYMAGPAIVIPTSRAEANANDTPDALVNFLTRSKWISTYGGETGGPTDATEAHAGWIRDFAIVALAVDAKREAGSRSIDAGFDAADKVATSSRNIVDSRLKFLAGAFYVLAIALIFSGNLLPKLPINLLAATLTTLAALEWARQRKHGTFRLFVYARALAEGMRMQRALNAMGLRSRAVDLLRYRTGPVPTTLRELLRSIQSTTPAAEPGKFENCAGWLNEQIAYYTGSAQVRQSRFDKREWFRKNILIGGGSLLLFLWVVVQVWAWFFKVELPPVARAIALASVMTVFMIGILMGVHTIQMQLREQGAAFARMRDVLLTYRDWMSATEQTKHSGSDEEKANAAKWLLAQALSENEEWCLRQSGVAL